MVLTTSRLALLLAALGVAQAQINILKVTNAADYTNTSGIQFEIPQNGGLAVIHCTGLAGSPGTISAPAFAFPLPVALAGISVDVFGVPAPILSVAFLSDQQQIEIQVPWESIASSPAYPGEFIIAYATGMGPSGEPQPTGYPPPPNSTISGLENVLLAGTPIQVLFEGLAPGLVGVNQINFQVPSNASAGNLALQLSITLTGCFPFGICMNGQQPQTVTEISPSVMLPVN
jgi:hypothetical protein